MAAPDGDGFPYPYGCVWGMFHEARLHGCHFGSAVAACSEDRTVILQQSIDKRGLSERDICTKFIAPAIASSGWSLLTQIREELDITKSRVTIRGNLFSSGKGKRTDYVLYIKTNISSAVIEAKDNGHAIGAGMQQALDYAAKLAVPFAFTYDGGGFLVHDPIGQSTRTETLLALNAILCVRRFVLDIAVCGKLVEQRQNEEPAAALLKRIDAENVRLVNKRRDAVRHPAPTARREAPHRRQRRRPDDPLRPFEGQSRGRRHSAKSSSIRPCPPARLFSTKTQLRIGPHAHQSCAVDGRLGSD